MSDHFVQHLDLTRWSVVVGDGCDQGLCGWGNNEEQHYTESSVMVRDGVLQIRATQLNDRIESGKIVSAGKFSQRYGRFEARVRLPEGRGLWPAFWLMPDNTDLRWPLAGEIDIMEWTGNDPHRLIGAAHFGGLPPQNVHYSETVLMPHRWDGEWHIFALNWRPGHIQWEVDGRVYGELTPNIISSHRWPFDDGDFYVILNMAVGGTLGGQVALEDLPATLLVDWVKVFPISCLTNEGK